MLSHPHAVTLEQRRARNKADIEEELSHPGCDDLRVSELKRRNLALKDEIVVLEAMAG